MLTINDCVYNSYQTSLKHGFWDGLDIDNITVLLSKLMLVVTEVAEAAEELRKPTLIHDVDVECKGNDTCQDWHFIPDMSKLSEEIADICIRVFDLAGAIGCDLQTAMQQKMIKNEQRPYKHGKLA